MLTSAETMVLGLKAQKQGKLLKIREVIWYARIDSNCRPSDS